jgi:hypothetical protein
MLVPLLGFILSTTLFAVVGAVVLWLSGVRPLRLPVLAAFVGAAQVGLLAYAAAYGAVFADESNRLRSAPAVLGILVGMPVAGTLTGWVAARALANRLRRRGRP